MSLGSPLPEAPTSSGQLRSGHSRSGVGHWQSVSAQLSSSGDTMVPIIEEDYFLLLGIVLYTRHIF